MAVSRLRVRPQPLGGVGHDLPFSPVESIPRAFCFCVGARSWAARRSLAELRRGDGNAGLHATRAGSLRPGLHEHQRAEHATSQEREEIDSLEELPAPHRDGEIEVAELVYRPIDERRGRGDGDDASIRLERRKRAVEAAPEPCQVGVEPLSPNGVTFSQ